MTKEPKDLTPYEAAYIEWSARLGQTRKELRNWRITAVLSSFLVVLVLLALVIVLTSQKTYVYVAEVAPDSSIVSTVEMPQHFTPSEAQQSYFVGQFINNIMSMPLDPVIARQNWFDAYSMASGEALAQLTSFAQSTDPFDNLGNETRSIQISSINAVSNQSIQVDWTVTTYNSQGAVQDQGLYSGVFTLSQGATPTTTAQLLKNPFGLKITFFSINREG